MNMIFLYIMMYFSLVLDAMQFLTISKLRISFYFQSFETIQIYIFEKHQAF